MSDDDTPATPEVEAQEAKERVEATSESLSILVPIDHDDAYDTDNDVDLFDTTLYPKITMVMDDVGTWYVQIDTLGAGYVGHTYWRLRNNSTADGLNDLLLSMLQAGEDRDRG